MFHHPLPDMWDLHRASSLCNKEASICNNISYYRWRCQKTMRSWVDGRMPGRPGHNPLSSQSIPSTHPLSDRPWETQRSATAPQAQCKKLCCEQRRSCHVCCVVSQQLISCLYVACLTKYVSQMFEPATTWLNVVWLLKPNSADWQLTVCLIKRKLKKQWKEVKGLTCPSDNEPISSKLWPVKDTQMLSVCSRPSQKILYLFYLCHTNLKTQWFDSHRKFTSHHDAVLNQIKNQSSIVLILVACSIVKLFSLCATKRSITANQSKCSQIVFALISVHWLINETYWAQTGVNNHCFIRQNFTYFFALKFDKLKCWRMKSCLFSQENCHVQSNTLFSFRTKEIPKVKKMNEWMNELYCL